MSPAACGLALLALDRAPPLVRLPPAPPTAQKAERDAFGSFPHELASTNFVVKWGDAMDVRESQVAIALDALELAWKVEIASMGHPAPAGTDAWKFNVYVGDSGSGAPPGYGAAGYYYRDDEGFPYIVLAADTLESDYLTSTTAHEFYHSLQDQTGSWPYSGVSAWYWEATAMWMEGEVYPDDPDYHSFLFGYALLPDLPLWYFDYPDTGALGEYHQYGAMIWPRFLSEQVADWTVVRDSWVSPGVAATPQAALADALAARGIDVGSTFAAFAAHNALWDYTDGDAMAADIEGYERYFRDEARPVAATISGTTDGPVDAPVPPQAWGYSVVDWNHEEGRYDVAITADVAGSEGSRAAWGVTLAWVGADGPVYTPVALLPEGDTWAGSTTVELGSDVTEAWLVAAVLGDDVSGERAVDGETWAWAYEVADAPEDTGGDDTGGPTEAPGDGERKACGCGTGSAPASVGMLLAAGLVARRRYRSP